MENLNNTDKTLENAEKELRISDVSGQLVDFLTWYIHKSEFSKDTYSIKLIVKEYLKSTNLR